MYEVLLERSVERQLTKLEPRTCQRVATSLKKLAGNPFPSGCRKLTGSKNDWRIRVGVYRIIYEVDRRRRVVRVMRVRHRRDVYR